MNITSPYRQEFYNDASSVAAQAVNRQVDRLERNIAEVAQSDFGKGQGQSIATALVEQQEIVRAVQANAKSLQVANQTLGTLLDVTV